MIDWLWLVHEFYYLSEAAIRRGDMQQYRRFAAWWDLAYTVFCIEIQESLRR